MQNNPCNILYIHCMLGGMVEVNRIRKPRMVTLNPELVAKLLQVGAASPSGESNLSRLIDAAMEDYIRVRWKPEMSTAVEPQQKPRKAPRSKRK